MEYQRLTADNVLMAAQCCTGSEDTWAKLERARMYLCHGDNWLPASGGTETPFVSRSGLRLLYCWQPATGKHAYINCDTDILLTDEEARAALMLY